MSQSTTSNVKSNSTIIIQPKTPPGFELVNSETLKMLFAVKEQKEAEVKAAAAHIDALVADREVWKTLVEKQDSTILLYKENQGDYILLQKSFQENIKYNNKLISTLTFKVKLWKGVAIAVPVISAGVFTYFKFIK